MSGRSPTSHLITAGLVGVGVGVLAAGISFAMANNSPTSHLSLPSEKRRSRSDNSLDRKGSPQNIKANAPHERQVFIIIIYM